MAHALFPIMIVVLAGSMAAVQATMNGALGAHLGSGTAAAALSFGIGFVALMAVLLVTGDTAHLTRATSVNHWLLLGGLLGAFYVWAVLWAIPVLGVLTTVAAMILGQVIVALFLDATGAWGVTVTQISPTRLLAVVLVAGGLVLSKF